MNPDLTMKEKVQGWLSLAVMVIVLATCAGACFGSSDEGDRCLRNDYGHEWCDTNGDNRLTSDEVH